MILLNKIIIYNNKEVIKVLNKIIIIIINLILI